MNKNEKDRNYFGKLIFSSCLSMFGFLILSLKNIINLGYQDFLDNIFLHISFSVFLFSIIFIGIYLSEKYSKRKDE